MIITLPYEMTQELELGLGKERAQKFITFFEKLSENIEEKANGLAIQKKLEVKDELSKELANKSDLNLVETRLDARIQQLNSKMEFNISKLNMKINLLMILMIIIIGLLNPVVTKLISNWLKLGL